ncbi:hypothetical protein NW768_008340 [Fusarium equiseti]|uniref:Uncharacterized protein n=1 Tax=Fusarium equiseti TaxID=61235 RepID=A0ABQ8R6G0_FUSEQ|nr:hypothetical protein NW768_008340 [Fusarium equiseti]
MCQKPGTHKRQKKGNSQQQQDGSCTEASCAQGEIDPSRHQYTEMFHVPASQGPITQDYDHRSMITIQSEHQSPQDIWFVSPTQRVLYQPMQWWDTAPEGPPPGATPTENTVKDERKHDQGPSNVRDLVRQNTNSPRHERHDTRM